MDWENYLIAGTFLLFVGSCYMFNTSQPKETFVEDAPSQEAVVDETPAAQAETSKPDEAELNESVAPEDNEAEEYTPPVPPELPAEKPAEENLTNATPTEEPSAELNQSERFTLEEFKALCGSPPTGASLVEEGSGVLWFEYYQFPGGTKVGPYIKWFDKSKTQARMFRCYNKDGENNGPAVDWDQNGNKEAEYYYVNGTYDGPYREWVDGILIKELNYVMGKRDGQQNEYSVDGVLLETESYILGMKDGIWSTYYPNGQLKEKTSYSDDIKNANYWLYYEDGSLQSKRVGGLDGNKFTGVLYNYNHAEDGVQEGTECEFVNDVNVGCRDITQNI